MNAYIGRKVNIKMEKLIFESEKCYLCKKPKCQAHCPIATSVPEVIQLFKANKIEEAGKILFENNPLSAICAIVCPHETQCVGNCIKGIKGEPVEFCKIEEYISNYYLDHVQFEKPKETRERIAIIGGGPAGITLALILGAKGYKVTIFETHEKIGGVLRYGIPEYRLSNSLIDKYEKKLKELGVKIRPNILIGPVVTLEKLFADGYEAIFIGTGVWNPRTLNIKGEMSGHVNYAINYLMSPETFRLGKKVIVIGAGNVAMDAARVAKRSGADVTIVYRKGFEEMTATKLEIKEAKEDGVKFVLFKSPVEILEHGVKFITVEKTVLEDGKASYKNVENSEEIIECDSVIIAVSQSPKNNIVANTENLETSKGGLLAVDDFGRTTRKGVFASGDVVTGAKTVVEAVANSKKVADAMDEYCKEHMNIHFI